VKTSEFIKEETSANGTPEVKKDPELTSEPLGKDPLGSIDPPDNQTQAPAQPATTTKPTNTATPKSKPTAGDRPGWFSSLFNKNAAAQRNAGKQVKTLAEPRIRQWFTKLGLDPTLATDPKGLQNFVTQMVKSRLTPEEIKPPQDLSKEGMIKYITDYVGKWAASTNGIGANNATIGSYGYPKSDITVDINGIDYKYTMAKREWSDENGEVFQNQEDIQKLNQAAYEKVNPGAATRGPGNLPKGVSILNQDPIIIRYKNTDYAFSNKGGWTALKGDSSNLESFTAYLDQIGGMTESADFGQMLWNKMKRTR
jgi:hypothetical protein